MKATLTHLALHVRDLEASRRFYSDYCGLEVVHERGSDSSRTLWIAEKGKEREFVIVLIGGGEPRAQAPDDFGHLGFALESREQVDALAKKAEQEGVLIWAPRSEPHPVGYYCGIKDPDGRAVEFSYGQPLGPGASIEFSGSTKS